MKRATALRYAHEIARRIKTRNGLWGTPTADWTCLRIRRVWIFGSTVKGKERPNDLDILIDDIECGYWQTAATARWSKRRMNARAIPKRMAPMGLRFAVDCKSVAYREISSGMRMVRFHAYQIDGSIARPRIMIYPRNDITDIQ